MSFDQNAISISWDTIFDAEVIVSLTLDLLFWLRSFEGQPITPDFCSKVQFYQIKVCLSITKSYWASTVSILKWITGFSYLTCIFPVLADLHLIIAYLDEFPILDLRLLSSTTATYVSISILIISSYVHNSLASIIFIVSIYN